MRILQSERLVLEPQVAAHAAEMFVVLSDPAIYEFENEPPASLQWLRERFTQLETRASGDGSERWLNWIIRVASGELIGYVQASVPANGGAFIAYELTSAHWGYGYGREAVNAMLVELAAGYDVRQVGAVFKRPNHRSRKLLTRLDFVMPTTADREHYQPDDDEDLLVLAVGSGLHHAADPAPAPGPTPAPASDPR